MMQDATFRLSRSVIWTSRSKELVRQEILQGRELGITDCDIHTTSIQVGFSQVHGSREGVREHVNGVLADAHIDRVLRLSVTVS